MPVLTIIIIALVWTLFGFWRRGQLMGLPSWTIMQRRKLRRRVKSKDIPILCESHAQKLHKGDMALIDHQRCQKCFPAPKVTWPPPKPVPTPGNSA